MINQQLAFGVQNCSPNSKLHSETLNECRETPSQSNASKKIVHVPGWMRSLSRIALAILAIILVTIVMMPRSVAVGPAEGLIIIVIGGLGSFVMAFLLSRRTIRRETMAIALFIGLGPLGLLLYLVIKDGLQPAQPDSGQNPISTRFNANQIGIILIGLGAAILFFLLTWILLVAFEAIGASPWSRDHAGDIAGCCLLATFVFVFAGLLLRKQIRGHAAWIDMLSLGFCSVFGPLRIGYWMRQRMQRTVTDERLTDNAGKAIPKQSSVSPPVVTKD